MLLDRLFVIYRDSVDDSMSGPPVPLAVLEVLDFNERLLGCTQVVRVDPHYVWSARHPSKVEPVERLVGRTYNCLGQACQRVYAAYHGTAVRTEFMNRFEVYLRSSEIDPALLGEISYERLSRGVRLTEWCSPALAAARVESLEIPPLVTPQPARPGDPWEGWIPVGSGRPYVHSGTPPHAVEQLQREARRVALEGGFFARERSRDAHKRSHAEANPLEEGELRGKKRRNSIKEVEPGRLVFLKDHVRSRGPAHATHPHVVVSSSLQRIGGVHQARRCVVLRPLPEAAALLEATHAVVDTVGLKEEFARTWREHVVAPGSLLEEAMLEAVGLHRMRTTPPQGMKGAWKRLAPGIPNPWIMRGNPRAGA